MARRRRLAPAGVGGVPVELTDRHHPIWDDPQAVADLAAKHRLTLSAPHHGSLTAAPWWARFDAFRAAWCEASGLMHPVWRTIDWPRARAAGVDMSASSRYRLRPNDGRDVPREKP